MIKDLTKDANEQPDVEVHRVRSKRVLSTGASVELGCTTSQLVDVFTNLKAVQTSLSGVFTEVL